MGAPAPEAGLYAAGAPVAAAGVYAGAGSYAGAPVVSAPSVVSQSTQTYAAGAPSVQQHTEYGVVGHQVVQTGVQSVVAGHQYAVAGVEHVPQPATSYVAGPAKNSAVTVPIAPPALPVVAPQAAIPAAPRNLGPAPADTVTQQKILAPVRSHVRITPQATNIVPQVNVQKYNVDVPVHVPTPVAREVVVNKHVAAPYEVAVPRVVPVAAPYKVHPVQEIVETPHIHHATYTTHSAQKVVTPVHTPVHAVSQEVVGVQKSVEHVGYAAAGPAVATAHVSAVGAAAGSAAAPLPPQGMLPPPLPLLDMPLLPLLLS